MSFRKPTHAKGVTTTSNESSLVYRSQDVLVDFANSKLMVIKKDAATSGSNGRGVFGGGVNNSTTTKNNIDYLSIQVQGNSSNFGQLTVARIGASATSNGILSRGIFVEGTVSGVQTNTIDYITISTLGNASAAGQLSGTARYMLSGASNGTNDRGVFAGGIQTGGGYYTGIDYVTISSNTNGSTFGSISLYSYDSFMGSCSNATGNLGIFAGGGSSQPSNSIFYVNISTLGNGINFGNMTLSRYYLAGTSNGVSNRGILGGGQTTASNGSSTNTIDYLTITTPSNALSFGYLSSGRTLPSATSNGISGMAVFGGGDSTSASYGSTTRVSILDYVSITNLGNASSSGNLTDSISYLTATSNS